MVALGILNSLANSITPGALGASALVNTLAFIASEYFVTCLIRNSSSASQNYFNSEATTFLKLGGSLLNQFCQQLFKCDTGLAKWIDDLEIDGQILINSDANSSLAVPTKGQESREAKVLDEAGASPLDCIVDKVQNFSKLIGMSMHGMIIRSLVIY